MKLVRSHRAVLNFSLSLQPLWSSPHEPARYHAASVGSTRSSCVHEAGVRCRAFQRAAHSERATHSGDRRQQVRWAWLFGGAAQLLSAAILAVGSSRSVRRLCTFTFAYKVATQLGEAILAAKVATQLGA